VQKLAGGGQVRAVGYGAQFDADGRAVSDVLSDLLDDIAIETTFGRAAALIAAAIMAFEDAQNVRLPEETESRWKQSGRLEALRGRD